MKPTIKLRSAIVITILTALVVGRAALAQHTEGECDLEALVAHQEAHALELEEFHHLAESDLDAALATLYRTAIAYQALAVNCGFADTAAVEAEHEAEHEAADHTEGEPMDMLAVARSVGDPEQGKVLFNTFRTEVSFACATCHYVDKADQLVGPGLLGVSSATHDHAAHEAATEATAEPAGHGHSGAEATEAAGHDDHPDAEATPEATPAAARTIEETIVYLHTSIVDPSAYVVPNFPDDLMPKIYHDIFSEEDINNLVAYLLTL